MNTTSLRSFAPGALAIGILAASCSTPPPVSGSDAGEAGVPVADACVENVLCVRGDHWDPTLCRCVPNADAGVDAGADACVDIALCIRGDHWDPALCRCVPDQDASPLADACVETRLCLSGYHWDPIACRCVPATAGVPVESSR